MPTRQGYLGQVTSKGQSDDKTPSRPRIVPVCPPPALCGRQGPRPPSAKWSAGGTGAPSERAYLIGLHSLVGDLQRDTPYLGNSGRRAASDLVRPRAQGGRDGSQLLPLPSAGRLRCDEHAALPCAGRKAAASACLRSCGTPSPRYRNARDATVRRRWPLSVVSMEIERWAVSGALEPMRDGIRVGGRR
jgi:hypothetical protein